MSSPSIFGQVIPLRPAKPFAESPAMPKGITCGNGFESGGTDWTVSDLRWRTTRRCEASVRIRAADLLRYSDRVSRDHDAPFALRSSSWDGPISRGRRSAAGLRRPVTLVGLYLILLASSAASRSAMSPTFRMSLFSCLSRWAWRSIDPRPSRASAEQSVTPPVSLLTTIRKGPMPSLPRRRLAHPDDAWLSARRLNSLAMES
jgi:hypothetical protein